MYRFLLFGAVALAQSTTQTTTAGNGEYPSATTSATESPTPSLIGKCYLENKSKSTSMYVTSTASIATTSVASFVLPTLVPIVVPIPIAKPITTTITKAKASPRPRPQKPRPAPQPFRPTTQPQKPPRPTQKPQPQNPPQHPRPIQQPQPQKPPQPPRPIQQPQPQKPPQAQPNTPPPSYNPNSGLVGDCLNTFNTARYQEDRGPPLVWDDFLAQRAGNSASYCANVAQRHTDVVGGQILFITKTSCSAGIKGWFHDEKSYRGGHYLIIKNHKYKKVGCAVIGSGRKCISCNFR
jgi:hypothetical protein